MTSISPTSRGTREVRPIGPSSSLPGVMAVLLLLIVGLLLWQALSRSQLYEAPPDVGFNTDGLMALHWPGARSYPEDYSRALPQLLAGLRRIPAVTAATICEPLPFSQNSVRQPVWAEEQEGNRAPRMLRAAVLVVGPEYFQTLGIPLLTGRYFESRDGAGSSPVAIVDRAFDTQMWPSESPIGQRIRFNKVGPWATIVGVYDNARYEIAEPTPPHIYLPAAQHSDVVPGLLLRTSGDATIVVETARQIAKDLLPGELELEAFNVRPLDLEPIADD